MLWYFFINSFIERKVRRFQGKFNRIGLGIIGLGLVGALCLIYFFYNPEKTQDNLVLYGNVDIRQVDLGFRVGGRLEKMLFEEGDAVKKGDVLALLDKAPYEANLALAEANLAQNLANYKKLLSGNRPQEIEEARAGVREKIANFQNSDILYKREKKQLKTGSTSQQAHDNAQAQQKEAEALLKSAQESLSLAEEGFRKEDIEAGKAAVEMAKAELESARINLQDSKILAPSDGIILTRVREPGAIVGPGANVYTLSLHKPVWIRAYVSEPDLGHLKPGMEAFVTTDTSPNHPFKGHVGFISPQAEFTPKTVETPELRTDLVYRLRIIVENPKGQLRQGMPVTVHMRLKPL